MKISIFGSGREVGRSAILLSNGKNLLLDCGIKVRDEENPTGFPKINTRINYSIITHGHLDHCGFIPAIKNCIFFSTPPTLALSEILIKDAKKVDPSLPFNQQDIEKMSRNFILIPYKVEQKIDNFSFILHDAGHIPGSAIVEIKTNGKKIVYTGDFKLEETRLQKGGEIVEDVDILIIECTYSYKNHEPRKKIEKEFVKSIEETIKKGGNVILPAFGVGRTQELALILYSYDVNLPVYVDGMGVTVSKTILNYPAYVKNYLLLRQSIQNLREVMEKNIFKEPCVIISTAGMVEGGPVINYILSLDKIMKEAKEKNVEKYGKIIFTGFCKKCGKIWENNIHWILH
ncbi:MAG: MBL fold metallo-hydrolase [Candidatus Micrarchaeia archaeon]